MSRMGQDPPHGGGSKLGRRALLTAGVLGACAAGVAAAPYAAQRVQDAERAAVLAELSQLEGIPLDAAIQAAEITRMAVQTLVLPLAQFVALTGRGALSALLAAVDAARAALAVVHISTTVLDQFRLVVVSWQASVTALPIALDAYLTADIQSAETYLKTLKRMIQSQQSAAIHL
jgi:hypothetical protein